VLQPVVGKIFKVQSGKYFVLFKQAGRIVWIKRASKGEPNKPTSPLVGGAGCVNKSYDSLKLETLASKTLNSRFIMAWQQRTVRLLLLLSGAVVSLSGCSVPLVGFQKNLLLSPWSRQIRRAIPYLGTPLANKIAPLHAQFCPTDPNFVVAAVQR